MKQRKPKRNKQYETQSTCYKAAALIAFLIFVEIESHVTTYSKSPSHGLSLKLKIKTTVKNQTIKIVLYNRERPTIGTIKIQQWSQTSGESLPSHQMHCYELHIGKVCTTTGNRES